MILYEAEMQAQELYEQKQLNEAYDSEFWSFFRKFIRDAFRKDTKKYTKQELKQKLPEILSKAKEFERLVTVPSIAEIKRGYGIVMEEFKAKEGIKESSASLSEGFWSVAVGSVMPTVTAHKFLSMLCAAMWNLYLAAMATVKVQMMPGGAVHQFSTREARSLAMLVGVFFLLLTFPGFLCIVKGLHTVAVAPFKWVKGLYLKYTTVKISRMSAQMLPEGLPEKALKRWNILSVYIKKSRSKAVTLRLSEKCIGWVKGKPANKHLEITLMTPVVLTAFIKNKWFPKYHMLVRVNHGKHNGEECVIGIENLKNLYDINEQTVEELKEQ